MANFSFEALVVVSGNSDPSHRLLHLVLEIWWSHYESRIFAVHDQKCELMNKLRTKDNCRTRECTWPRI